MKRLFLCMSFAFAAMQYAEAQQLKTPMPSPTSTVKQDFGLSAVEVNYSRPGIKGRKVFGDLVPYGKVWRTGANAATIISFGEDVTIGDKPVPAGKYGLLSIPGETEWILILSRQLDVTSPADYKQEQDLVRVSVKPQPLPQPVQNFLIAFDDIRPESMNLQLLWDKTLVSLPIKVSIDGKITKQIDALMNKDNKPYFASAMYYMETGKDLNTALGWFEKATELNPTAFWVFHQKANCLAKLGRKQDAIAAANKSIELAKAAKNDDYVALNRKLLETLH